MRVDSSIIVSGLCVKPRPNEWIETLNNVNKSISLKWTCHKDLLGGFSARNNKIDALGIRRRRVTDEQDARDWIA